MKIPDYEYDEQELAIMAFNEEKTKEAIENLQPYVNGFDRRGMKVEFVTSPMYKYPDVVITDKNYSLSIEMPNVRDKEDFVKKYPEAVYNMQEELNRMYARGTVDREEINDFINPTIDKFYNNFKEVTERDRETSFSFSFEAKPFEKDVVPEAVVVANNNNDREFANLRYHLNEDFVYRKDVEYGWYKKMQDANGRTSDKNTFELMGLANHFTGEEVHVFIKLDSETKGSLVITGNVTNKTARALADYCNRKDGLGVTGYRVPDFREKWDKEVVNVNHYSRPKVNLRPKAQVNNKDVEKSI